MSQRELKRAGILERVAGGELSLVEGSELMGLSYRQGKRLWKKYGEKGPAGLVHGNVGRVSNRAKPKKFRQRVLKLVREKYSGGEEERFGPTLAAEHLGEEDGLEVEAETLRRWMLEEGLWSRQRKRKGHRRRRLRREHFGELVQLDGSFHEWLEGRGPRGCLMNLVDDATSRTLARLGEEETTWAAADVLRAWVEEYGIPAALYTDWKNVYVREPTAREVERGEEPLTQFGRMCRKLGTKIIAASSPQAKGRVERNHGIHQDRLIKKMRRKKISSFAEGNRYLEQEYLGQHNARFAVEAARSADFHRRVEGGLDLRRVFCLEEERTVSNDWVVRYKNRWLQIERGGRVYPSARGQVTVEEWREGSLHLVYRGQEMSWKEIQPKPVGAPALPKAPARRRSVARWKPAADHPWRSAVIPEWKRKGTSLEAGHAR